MGMAVIEGEKSEKEVAPSVMFLTLESYLITDVASPGNYWFSTGRAQSTVVFFFMSTIKKIYLILKLGKEHYHLLTYIF